LGAIGAFGPYFGLVLDRMGYSALAIGGLLGLMPLTRILLSPAWALVADKYRMGTRILQVASLVTVLVVGAIATGWLPLWAVGVGMVLFAGARAPIGPILDALTVRALEARGEDPGRYGRIRLWGSVAFLACGAGAALLADRVAWAPAPFALAAAVWLLGLLVLLRLPDAKADGPVALGPALRTLAQQPGIGLVVLALPLHGLGLNAYDAWYAVHIEHLGLASTWTGVALATGVSVEIAVMALAVGILRRMEPVGLVALSMAVAALRWALVAWLQDPWLLTLVQLSHGLVFAVFWIGVVELFRKAAPSEVRASAQSVVITATYGLGPLLTAMLASSVVDRFGTSALYAVAAGASVLATGLTLAARGRMRAAFSSP
jgi:MFS transporter, PPP family, 3-phenylpropionic acid transporter